jgi:ATP-binding cassette subfamily C protein
VKIEIFQLLTDEILDSTKLTLSGNTPILINQPEQIWLVLKGYVDIFAVPVHNGEPAGVRSHILRVVAGSLIPNIPELQNLKSDKIGLLAVGTIGTEILKVSRITLANQPQSAIAALIDKWIIDLSTVLVGTNILWAEYVAELGEVTVPEGATLCGKHQQVVWVTVEEGGLRYLDHDDGTLGTTNDFLPLIDKSWMRATESSRISCIDTNTAFAQSILWEALDHFHTLAMTLVEKHQRTVANAESERLIRKTAAMQQAVEGAYQRLGAVLQPDQTQVFIEEGETDPLFAALQLVGQALGVNITSPPKQDMSAAVSERITQIAEAYRLRQRRLVRADDWWRRDNGPLLGFLGEELRPVALLPVSPRRYEMVDPSTKTRQRVTPDIAHELSGSVFMLYRSFPNQILTVFNIFRFGARGIGSDLIVALLISLIVSLLALMTPVASGMLFEFIIPRTEMLQLFHLVVALGMIALGTALFELTKAFALLRIESQFDWTIQAAVWDRLLSLPIPFFKNYTAGDLTDRALSISTIRQLLAGTTITSLLASLFSLSSLALLFYYNERLALIAVLLAAIAMSITLLLSYFQLHHQRLMLAHKGKIEGIVFQFITGINKLRVAACEPKAMAVWIRRFAEMKTHFVKANTYENLLVVFHATFPLLASMLIFATIAKIILEGETAENTFSTGDFIAFNVAFGQFLAAMYSMTTVLTDALMIVPLWERVKPILDARPENTLEKQPPGKLQGNIELSNITFRYIPEGPVILDKLSLSIKSGQFVAIVGASGSGKSTIFRLLLGFEAPESGAIYYDGKNLAMLNIAAVRQQIGVALQNGKITAGSLFENIVGNAPLATHEDAWQAARMVGLDKDIEAMPMGLHTVLMDGATTLSGGQRQRLILARALVHKPRILLLDEATSALDNQTQAIVIESLLKLNVTRIMIAHRLSTITHVDKIVVLDKGSVVQEGNYDDIMGQAGAFAELAKRQLL